MKKQKTVNKSATLVIIVCIFIITLFVVWYRYSENISMHMLTNNGRGPSENKVENTGVKLEPIYTVERNLVGTITDVARGEGGGLGKGVIMADVDLPGQGTQNVTIMLGDPVTFEGINDAGVQVGEVVMFPVATLLEDRTYYVDAIVASPDTLDAMDDAQDGSFTVEYEPYETNEQ